MKILLMLLNGLIMLAVFLYVITQVYQAYRAVQSAYPDASFKTHHLTCQKCGGQYELDWKELLLRQTPNLTIESGNGYEQKESYLFTCPLCGKRALQTETFSTEGNTEVFKLLWPFALRIVLAIIISGSIGALL